MLETDRITVVLYTPRYDREIGHEHTAAPWFGRESLPFRRGEVKVIAPHGNEVMSVHDLDDETPGEPAYRTLGEGG